MSEQTYSVPPAVLAAIRDDTLFIPTGSVRGFTALSRYLDRRGYATVSLAEIYREIDRRGIPRRLVHRARAVNLRERSRMIEEWQTSSR